MKVPYPHQVDGIRYATSRKGGGFIYSEPRTGKTLITTSSVSKFPALVIAPSTVLATWEGALLEEGETDILILDSRHNKTILELRNLLHVRYKWVLINFEKIERIGALEIFEEVPKALGLSDWGSVIVDESYRIANPEASVTKYILSHPPKPHQSRYCLSGYPMCETAIDIAPQALFVDGEYFGCKNIDDYLEKFWYWNPDRYKYLPKSALHLDAVQAWIKSNSWGVKLSDLGLGGEILIGTAMIPVSEIQSKWLSWVVTVNAYKKPEDSEEMEPRIMYPPIRGTFEQQIAAGLNPLTKEIIDTGKIDWCVNHYLETKEPLLILSRLTTPLKRMVEEFEKKGIKVGMITGSTPLSEREEIRQSFQSGTLDVVVAQVKTVKMGLDFSRLSKIIYFTLPWGYDDWSQSVLRGQHISRKEPYEVVILCTEQTSDRKTASLLSSKKVNVEKYLPEILEELRIEWQGRV